MSWEVANDKRLLGQFASGGGFAEFSKALDAKRKKFPALAYFFDHGLTTEVQAVRAELKAFALEAEPSITISANTLRSLMKDQPIVIITQGAN